MRAALLVLLLAGCGSAQDDPPAPQQPAVPVPRPAYGAPICTDVVDGHKVTYYCDNKRSQS
jgi:hypothetical protein